MPQVRPTSPLTFSIEFGKDIEAGLACRVAGTRGGRVQVLDQTNAFMCCC